MRSVMALLRVFVLVGWVCVICAPAAVAECDPLYVPPSHVYIYGQADWYDEGDVIQFVGDSDTDNPGAGGCYSHGYQWSDCPIDKGFTFRRVWNLDLENCSFTVSDTCEVAKVPCCIFWNNEGVCPGCGTCCVLASREGRWVALREGV